jgi:hypothetical protein
MSWYHSQNIFNQMDDKICACLFGAKIYNIPCLFLLYLFLGFIFKLSSYFNYFSLMKIFSITEFYLSLFQFHSQTD